MYFSWLTRELLVANALLNIPFSKELAVEVLTRLFHPPADVSDSRPEDEYHLTSGAPDVLYDEKTGVYEAKSEHTLGGAACIEETDRMRKHQTKLLKAVELYETEIGSKNIMLSTGISLASQHGWGDVLNEAEAVRKRYRPREGSDSIPTLQNSFRTFELAQPRVDQWLALLPSTAPCASRLCGGLKVIFAIIWRSGMLSGEIYNALKQIPITISHAQDLTLRYEPEALAEHVEQLFCAVISTLRHIICEYTRISANGHQVHFSQDFQLLNHYKHLIELEQQVVINQRVRVEALNSLKSMGDERWDLIFSVLNEQLTETQDDQELEDLDEGIMRTRETSVNADLYEALEYDHLLCHRDLKETMRCRFHFSAAENSRVTWLVENELLREWVTSPASELFFINGNEDQHERTSSVSVYCGMITRALQSQVPRIVLYWYCGLNVNEDIAGMLRNLIGQLLGHIEADQSPLKSDKKVWYAGLKIDDLEILFRLFKKILKNLLKSATVFCILDGISFYEDDYRAQDLSELIEALAMLVDNAGKSNFIFKVLLTSPNRSDIAEDVGGNVDIGHFEVLDMPGFVMTDRSELTEFEILRSISRRNSISSVGSTPTVYHEASEYLDD
ncbi:hypothetical protein F4677DRAFT_364491 [Hypoxylon crocopeplum]|nr:hypothetical protein F4677DRAFT_364491 [Hypoxylon crocopeplum]